MRVERAAPAPRTPVSFTTVPCRPRPHRQVEPVDCRSRRRSGYFTPGHCCHNLVYSAPRARRGRARPDCYTTTRVEEATPVPRRSPPARNARPARRNRHTSEALDRNSAPCRAVRVREFYAPHTAGDLDHQASASSRNPLAAPSTGISAATPLQHTHCVGLPPHQVDCFETYD